MEVIRVIVNNIEEVIVLILNLTIFAYTTLSVYYYIILKLYNNESIEMKNAKFALLISYTARNIFDYFVSEERKISLFGLFFDIVVLFLICYFL